MSEVIHEHSFRVIAGDGIAYTVRICAVPVGNEWNGWLEFHPLGGHAPVLRTERETTQATRADVEYWAAGLEPVYLEGALTRASAWHPDTQPWP